MASAIRQSYEHTQLRAVRVPKLAARDAAGESAGYRERDASGTTFLESY